jgi:hypothetical protein
MLAAGLRDTYPHVMRDPITEFNTLLIAADEPPSREKLEAAMPDVDPGVRPVLAETAARLGPSLPGGAVYTDDKAPVEWLIDRSIVSYAAEE